MAVEFSPEKQMLASSDGRSSNYECGISVEGVVGELRGAYVERDDGQGGSTLYKSMLHSSKFVFVMQFYCSRYKSACITRLFARLSVLKNYPSDV